MTDKNTFKRETLARVASLVRPALATKDYVPALTHILFDGGRATAYNDISAISVRCDLDLGRCVPGADFSGALASFGGSEVLVQLSKGDALSVKCGRGTLRLQTLPAADFPYEPPGSGGAEFALTTDILRGVERCLLNVGADSGHPAQSGVTLDADGGIAVLYSTDGATISRFVTSTKIKLPGDAPVILPKFFCEQVVSMARAFPEAEAFLVLHDGALQADFGAEATVFTRVPLDVTPLDFPRTFAKHARGGKDGMFDIPDLFDGALQRALLVLGQEKLKTARVHLAKGNLNLSAGSGSSQSEDDMKYDWDDADPTEPMRVDAALLARAAKVCTRMSFTESVTAFADADGDFTHIVAHVAKV